MDKYPAWSPDGVSIAFSSKISGNFDIWVIPSIGGSAIQITNNLDDDRFPTWSPNGSMIAYESDGDIWVVSGISDPTADLYPDGVVNLLDFAILTNYWSQRKPLADIAPDSGDGVVNFLDMAKIAEEWLKTESWYQP